MAFYNFFLLGVHVSILMLRLIGVAGRARKEMFHVLNLGLDGVLGLEGELVLDSLQVGNLRMDLVQQIGKKCVHLTCSSFTIHCPPASCCCKFALYTQSYHTAHQWNKEDKQIGGAYIHAPETQKRNVPSSSRSCSRR